MGEKQCGGRGRKEDAWQGRPLHTTMKRVKVYRLEDNGKWDDQGTGHVTIDYIKASREFVLAVVDEEDNDTLLLHNITPDDIYRKQEETVISWRDPEKALELALSFQEAEGCSIIWENMRNIREDLQSKILRCKSSSSVNGELKELPPLEMSSLSFSLKRDFPPKIVNLFTTCEDLEDRDGLHLMQTHRAFLKDHADLKEATPTRHASVVSKIHQRYRIRCIKDFWFNACLVLMIAFMFLPSTEAREVTRISECTNHNLLSRKISAACMTIQPLPICCELLVSAMDSKGCLCKLINDGTQVDIFLKKYIPCGGQHPNFVEETKNCSSLFPTKPAPSPEFVAPPPPPEFDAPPPPPPPEAAAPTPEVAAPTPEVAPPTPDKPSKSKIHWLLLVLIIVAVAGLLIFVCVELRKWKDAGRVAPNAPQQCELTATVIPNKRQTADVMIRNQALEIPINDAVPFLPLTRGRLNSARQ